MENEEDLERVFIAADEFNESDASDIEVRFWLNRWIHNYVVIFLL